MSNHRTWHATSYELLKVLTSAPTSDFRMCELAIAWRNRLGHSRTAERNISPSLKRNLLNFADQLRDKHRGLEIARCISDFNEGRVPTFKMVASLIQAS